MHLPSDIERDLMDLVFQPHDPYLSLDNRLHPFIDLLLRYGAVCAAAERERVMQAVLDLANTLPPDSARGWYLGYKEAIANVLAALRAT